MIFDEVKEKDSNTIKILNEENANFKFNISYSKILIK